MSDYYGYEVRDRLYRGEDEFFRSNPNVAGMAAEDGKIIFNPYSKGVNYDAVGRNEAARLWMRDNDVTPDFSVTDEQKKAFVGTPYEHNQTALKQTIAARIISGDPSAGQATPDQQKWAEKIVQGMKSGDNKEFLEGFNGAKK